MTLFERDSAADLLCRGFARDEILSRTSVDVGYNGNALKKVTRGVDRDEYKFVFVVETVSRVDFVAFLELYGDKTWTRGDVFAACGLAATVRVSFAELARRMGCEDEYEAAHEREIEGRDEVRRRTNRDKFGVDYPTQLPEFVERVRETTVKNYGGVGRASSEIRARMEATMVDRHGSVEGAMRVAREKGLATRARRRAEMPPREKKRRPYVPKRVVETWTAGDALFGVDTPRDLFCRGFSSEEIFARTGVECGYNCVELGLKISRVNRVEYAVVMVRERVGVDVLRAAMSGMKNKSEFLSFVGLASDWRLSVKDLCGKLSLNAEYDAMLDASYSSRTVSIQATMMERYGCKGSFQSQELAEKAYDTMEREYGARYSFQSDVVRARVREKYGCDSVAQNPKVKAKMLSTKRMNGTFNSSSSEENLFLMLVSVFGDSDVVRQFASDVYPTACDFYVKSRDLYVELNASWTRLGRMVGIGLVNSVVMGSPSRCGRVSRRLIMSMRLMFGQEVTSRSVRRLGGII